MYFLALFGLVPLVLVCAVAWAVARRTGARPAPLAGVLGGIAVAAWLLVAPDALVDSWLLFAIPAIFVALVAFPSSVGAGLVNAAVLAAVVVVGLGIYSLSGSGDGTALDGTGYLLFWLAIFLPGAVVGVGLGALLRRGADGKAAAA
ncbi:hypothetical protein [Corynebacterium sp.]|uniref:hypothetical protein n=1 Tax=Corynebacterium sp. TaxID=1720 RepID=UPI0026DD2231|nr:hypothetical protein [Corynebacterium sp.]MDO5031209.1 hypothetical protein [Corynebacterium sp.]